VDFVELCVAHAVVGVHRNAVPCAVLCACKRGHKSNMRVLSCLVLVVSCMERRKNTCAPFFTERLVVSMRIVVVMCRHVREGTAGSVHVA